MDPAAGGDSRLGARVMRGLGWKALSIAVTQGTRVLVLILLARLLDPDDFGLAAMVLVVSGLVFILSDLSLGAALVQRPVLTEEERSTVFWLSIGVGVVLTAAGIAVSGLVADFYGDPAVQPLFIGISVTFLLASLGTVQEALMVRDMRFRQLEIRQVCAVLVGGVTGVAIALAGGGAWAIIGQQIALFATGAALLWITARWRPHLMFSMGRLKELGGFGGNVLGSRLLFFAPRNLDNLLIGRYLGPAALGAYALAYNVSQMPLSLVSGPLDQVLYPAFSRLQDQVARLRQAFMRALRLICAVVAPGFLGLVAVAPDAVAVVLGEQWDAAIPVLQVLLVVGLVQSLQALNHSVLQARDRTRHLMRYAVVFAVLTIAAILAGLPFGILGVATALLVVSLVIEPLYLAVVARALETSPLVLLRNLVPGLLAAGLMAGAVAAARLGLAEIGVGAAARLVLCLLLGALVYPVLLWLIAPGVVADIRGLVRRRGMAPAPAVAPAAEVAAERVP